ncbi:putative Presequence translocated-associated motor subunit PAM17 [Seiridium cardinale]
MLTSTTQIMRFGLLGSRGLQLQSALCRGATVTSLAQRQLAAKAPKTICTASTRQAARKQPLVHCRSAARRYASTATGPAASASASSTPGLDWNTFFTLRKTRRRYQLACSVVTMLIGGSVAGLVLINVDVEFLGKLPLDPFITLGLITMSSAALGWLAGPSLGSTIFYMVKRGIKTPMATKEIEFFARIKKNRVDPSTSSVGNPVPDYYGEKISSVAGYRQWLKDQRAFNKKRTSFL